VKGYLRQRAMIDLSRVARVTIRGVEWISDGYVMARTDLFLTPPKDGKDARAIPAATARRLLDGCRSGVALPDVNAVLDGGRWENGQARLLYGYGRAVALNPKAAEEWLRHRWHAIRQGDTPPVTFWEVRRSKPTLVGLIMPVYVGHGTFKVDTLDGSA
jgi:hypothetical protein